MKKIILSLDKYSLGYLIEDKTNFIFHADKEGIEKATKFSVIKMKFFTLNRSGMQKYYEIPNHFVQYLDCLEREEIIYQANIKDSDSLFIKLYKIAGLTLNPINFSISQG